MNNQVIRTVSKYNMLEKGDKVLVALSGGADSVALLDVLNSIKEEYNLIIYAVHINHMLRGEESVRDEDFCRALAEKYELKLYVRHYDVSQLAKNDKISEELCGRNIRYSVFKEISRELGAKVATAHTASDNAETLLFNITRGASLSGICSIPPVRDNIIRPLIECTREQIEKYCQENGLEYVTDSTNLTDDYTRNKIRHNVVPLLKEINCGFERSILRLSENAREISDYINIAAQKAILQSRCEYGFRCDLLLSNHIAVVKKSLSLLCKTNAHFNAEQRHIDLILNIMRHGGAVELNKKYNVVSKQGILRFSSANNDNLTGFIELQEDTVFSFNSKIYKVTKNSCIKESKNTVSADFIGKKAVFRTRRSGDRFTYPKRMITKPLRKIMNEMKIPSELRDKLIVLAKDNEVLWCEKIGASASGNPDNSEKTLKIDVLPSQGE